MLVSAAGGTFDGGQRFRNWGVFVQQSVSYILQNGGKGRPRQSLVGLAEATWPAADTAALAANIIDDFLEGGALAETRSRFHLAGPIIERNDETPISMHSNIRSGPRVVPVRDQSTGEIIGHVSGAPASGLTSVGGKLHKVVANTSDGIVVTSEAGGAQRKIDPAPAKYPTVPFLITRRYCREVAKGIGLSDMDAPLISNEEGTTWWHFGGQAVEKLLRLQIPRVFPAVAVNGMALRVEGDPGVAGELFASEEQVANALDQVVGRARSRYSRSSFDNFLSKEAFSKVAAEALQPGDLFEFLRTRNVVPLPPSSTTGVRLMGLLR